MSRPPRTYSLTSELRAYRHELDAACRQRWGVSGGVYRSLNVLYNMLLIVFCGYLIEFEEVEPLIAMGFAVLLTLGWEGFTNYILNAADVDRHAERPGERERE